MISKKYIKTIMAAGIVFLLSAIFFSCHKTKIEPVEVYPDAPGALVKFLDNAPNPSIGTEGSEVVFSVSGLKEKQGAFEFFINQTKAEVLAVTENTVTVKVPSTASTGGSSILINGEYYFGPTFTVRGKVSIDPTFNPDLYKSNGPITDIQEFDASTLVATGGFTDYQNQANAEVKVPGIVKLDKTSLAYVGPGGTASQFMVGKEGIVGSVNTILPVGGDKYIIAGSFSQYDTIKNLNNITRINKNGSVDSMIVDVIGTPPLDKATVPSFNGGTGGIINNVFFDQDTKAVTVFGSFFFHTSAFYERSSVDGLYTDFVEIPQILRMKEDGSFDSTFNYNPATKKGNEGANGFLYDVVKLSNGDFLIGGIFTTFHKRSANNIVRISGTDGSVVSSFTGSADGPVNRIVKNEQTGNIIVTGGFKHYNGTAVNGVVMIDENGTMVPTFTFKEIDGMATFAGQMDNGKIIVSGSFTRYNGIIREGLAILNADGTLAAGYNNFGLFRGQVNNFIETKTAAGQPALILYGDFDKFDNKQVGNIVKIRFEN